MNNNTARRVMILAHSLRKAAAARFNCAASEILFSECLKLAWAEIKAETAKPAIKTNEQGFIIFAARDWGYRGDRGTWARVEKDGSITVQRAQRGIVSTPYTAELEKFCAAFGQDFLALGSGDRINFAA